MAGLIYAEVDVSRGLGVSQATLRKAAKAAKVGAADRGQVDVGGRTLNALSAAGVRAMFRWLCCEKNAPKSCRAVRERGLAMLNGLELLPIDEREKKGEGIRDKGLEGMGEKRPVELNLPGGWPMPEVVVLRVSRESKNGRILLCSVREEDRAGLRPAFAERGIDLMSTRLRVRVQRSENFTLGMEVPCGWVEDDYFVCSAGRMPRQRGRW